MKKQHQKVEGCLLFFLFYLLAYGLAFIVSQPIKDLLLGLFVFDLVATFVIWFCSLTIHNSSLYDPYWSLTPFVMLVYLVTMNWPLDGYRWLFVIVFSLWSIRLTINWLTTFKGLRFEDWRYQKYRTENSQWRWELINFFGIQFFPTVLVFIAFIPAYFLMIATSRWESIFGDVLIIAGFLLELCSDANMHAFLRENANLKIRPVCQKGLWKYSRHPNYLGEISVWFGVYFACLGSQLSYWYLFGGALLILALFLFISIPLAEKRQLARRPDYSSYQAVTSMLLLLPQRKLKE